MPLLAPIHQSKVIQIPYQASIPFRTNKSLFCFSLGVQQRNEGRKMSVTQLVEQQRDPVIKGLR
jgi:hypothetical protein